MLLRFFSGQATLFDVLVWIVAIGVAITVHEFAHAFVALRCGDDTAKRMGRVSLNPLAHYDIIGTTMILIGGFGWGKPVPVNQARLKDPRWDDVKVSLAGPASNLITVTALMVVNRFVPIMWGPWVPLSQTIIQINLMLAFFNLIPIAPLDGSHVLAGLLPAKQSMAYGRVMAQYGFVILLLVVFMAPGLLNILVFVPANAFLHLLDLVL